MISIVHVNHKNNESYDGNYPVNENVVGWIHGYTTDT